MSAHVFINPKNTIAGKDIKLYFALADYYSVSETDIVCSRFDGGMQQAFHFIENYKCHLRDSHYAKNSVEPSLMLLMGKAIYNEPSINHIIYIGGFSDISPAISMAYEVGKRFTICPTDDLVEAFFIRLLKGMKLEHAVEIIGAKDLLKTKIRPLPPELAALPTVWQEYFTSSILYRGQSVLVEKQGEFILLPFFNGMPFSIFKNLLMDAGVITDYACFTCHDLEKLGLKLKKWFGSEVWYQDEEYYLLCGTMKKMQRAV